VDEYQKLRRQPEDYARTGVDRELLFAHRGGLEVDDQYRSSYTRTNATHTAGDSVRTTETQRNYAQNCARKRNDPRILQYSTSASVYGSQSDNGGGGFVGAARAQPAQSRKGTAGGAGWDGGKPTIMGGEGVRTLTHDDADGVTQADLQVRKNVTSLQ
jgi:hypothetical protein